MTKTELSIIMALNQNSEIHGTEKLMEIIGIYHKLRVTRSIAILVKNGIIAMTPSAGGREKKTIYRSTAESRALFQVQR